MREVGEAHIRRSEAVNKRLNAVVIPLFEEALAQAEVMLKIIFSPTRPNAGD